jgi:hypothetical protein
LRRFAPSNPLFPVAPQYLIALANASHCTTEYNPTSQGERREEREKAPERQSGGAPLKQMGQAALENAALLCTIKCKFARAEIASHCVKPAKSLLKKGALPPSEISLPYIAAAARSFGQMQFFSSQRGNCSFFSRVNVCSPVDQMEATQTSAFFYYYFKRHPIEGNEIS